MARSKIEWCDRTWNPITGCPLPLVSPGCANCYARHTAETRLRGRCGYDADEPFGIAYHHDRYLEPLRWRQNSYVFTGSMGDLFHADVRTEELDAVFAVILACLILKNTHDHAFMFLTKRPDIMAAYFAPGPEALLPRWGEAGNGYIQMHNADMVFSEYVEGCCIAPQDCEKYPNLPQRHLWPLPNLWLGATACTQRELDENSRVLRSITAGYHAYMSLEPLLERIVLPEDFFGAVWQCPDCGWLDHGGWPHLCKTCGHAYEQMEPGPEDSEFDTLCPKCGVGACAGDAVRCPACKAELGMYEGQNGISWVIVGGETGQGARPMHPDWVRSLHDQCAAFRQPFFFKGWGEWAPRSNHPLVRYGTPASNIDPDCKKWECIRLTGQGNNGWNLENSGDRGEDVYMQRVGKKLSGRKLDGVEHSAMPSLFDHQHRQPLPF